MATTPPSLQALWFPLELLSLSSSAFPLLSPLLHPHPQPLSHTQVIGEESQAQVGSAIPGKKAGPGRGVRKSQSQRKTVHGHSGRRQKQWGCGWGCCRVRHVLAMRALGLKGDSGVMEGEWRS